MSTDDYPFKKECYAIIGACMELHNELGCGFLEAVYQEALAIVFEENRIPYQQEKVLDIVFRDRILKKKYVADYICYNDVLIELKATDGLHPEHTSQVLNYLKATGKRIGLLINFGTTKLQYKRIIL